jgi:3-deoxy-manno-octulosonate cytidylyltransferase (CMP-KDO synthetase)
MRTLAVIPARLAATRLPRKPLRLLGGIPLVVRVWQRIQILQIANHVVVATDDEEVAAVMRERGGDVMLTRPDHPSGTDRVAEVAATPPYDAFDVIANVQGDEPFVAESALRGAIDLVGEERFPVATIAAPATPDILDRPDVVKVICADDGRALYFTRAAVPHLRDRNDAALRDSLVRQHLGVYVYTRDALHAWVAHPVHALERVERLEQLRPMAAGIPIGVHVMDAPSPRGIDTEEDLILANVIWNDLYAGRM